MGILVSLVGCERKVQGESSNQNILFNTQFLLINVYIFLKKINGSLGWGVVCVGDNINL